MSAGSCSARRLLVTEPRAQPARQQHGLRAGRRHRDLRLRRGHAAAGSRRQRSVRSHAMSERAVRVETPSPGSPQRPKVSLGPSGGVVRSSRSTTPRARRKRRRTPASPRQRQSAGRSATSKRDDDGRRMRRGSPQSRTPGSPRRRHHACSPNAKRRTDASRSSRVVVVGPRKKGGSFATDAARRARKRRARPSANAAAPTRCASSRSSAGPAPPRKALDGRRAARRGRVRSRGRSTPAAGGGSRQPRPSRSISSFALAGPHVPAA